MLSMFGIQRSCIISVSAIARRDQMPRMRVAGMGQGNCGQKLNRNGNDCHPNQRRQSSLWYHGTIYST
jgi:hypothetical protein